MSLAEKIKDYLKRDETSEMSIHTDSFTLFLGKYPPKEDQKSQQDAKHKISSLVHTQSTNNESDRGSKSNIREHSVGGSDSETAHSKDTLLSEVKSVVGKRTNINSTDKSTKLQLPSQLSVKQSGGFIRDRSNIYPPNCGPVITSEELQTTQQGGFIRDRSNIYPPNCGPVITSEELQTTQQGGFIRDRSNIYPPNCGPVITSEELQTIQQGGQLLYESDDDISISSFSSVEE